MTGTCNNSFNEQWSPNLNVNPFPGKNFPARLRSRSGALTNSISTQITKSVLDEIMVCDFLLATEYSKSMIRYHASWSFFLDVIVYYFNCHCWYSLSYRWTRNVYTKSVSRDRSRKFKMLVVSSSYFVMKVIF